MDTSVRPGTISVEIGADGETPLRLEWALDAMGAMGGRSSPFALPAPWRAEHGLQLDEARLRVVSAAFEDGMALGLAGLRPPGATGHDAERLSATLFRPGADPIVILEALVSTQFDAEGSVSRLGIEVYETEDSAPLRIAADVGESQTREADGIRNEAVAMEFRVEGFTGSGLHEFLTRV